MNPRTWIKNWLPPLVWMLLIFAASTDLMSAEHTSRFIAPLLRWISPDVTPATVATVQFAVRKAAHVTEYAILAVLLSRALAVWSGGLLFRRLLLAIFVAGCGGALDEFHQSFVASRTGSAADVLIDISGALVGVALYWLCVRKGVESRRRTAIPSSEG